LIRIALQSPRFTGQQFEHFAVQLLRRELYPGLNPTSISNDLGEDARTESSQLFLHDGKYISVACAKTLDLDKVRSDCQRCIETGHTINTLVCVGANSSQTGTMERWKSTLKDEMGDALQWELEFITMDWIAPAASALDNADLVDEHLHIPPPGGDFVQDIQAAFQRSTSRLLSNTPPAIAGITVGRPELEEIKQRLDEGKPVLLLGAAGSGKSGLAQTLARTAQDQRRPVLLLDARRMAHIHTSRDLADAVGLHGALADAIQRMGRYAGCLVILDQYDTLVGTPAMLLFQDLIADLVGKQGVDLVVVSREFPHAPEVLAALSERGLAAVTSNPLSRETACDILEEIGIVSPPDELAELATNLLNLDLIARIWQKQPEIALQTLTHEVALWEEYCTIILKQEMVSDIGRAMLDEASRVAWEGIRQPTRTFTLPNQRTPVQERLLTWGVIEVEDGRVYRFRHEQLHDYFCARDAADRHLSPAQLRIDLEPHRAANIIGWIDKLYAHRGSVHYAQFLRDYLSPSSGIPFHGQARLIARVAREDAATLSKPVVDIFVDILRTRQDLRNSFFRSQPHPTWARVLWAHGFFAEPPPAKQDKDGHWYLTQWDVQHYLKSVAADVSDVVVQHVQSIEGPGWYIYRALDALTNIDPTQAVVLVPQIVTWMGDVSCAHEISHAVYELMVRFAEAGLADEPFALFQALTTPMPIMPAGTTEQRFWGYTAKPYGDHYAVCTSEVRLLAELDTPRLVVLLEAQLLATLTVENVAGRGGQDSSGWRSVIEETDQDVGEDFKDKLLTALRDVLVAWTAQMPVDVEPLLVRYLSSEWAILRRLGIAILTQFPEAYPILVASVLTDPENLDDSVIHHEFFQLLQHGYGVLGTAQQTELVDRICAGPTPEDLMRVADWAVSTGHVQTKDEYIRRYTSHWTLQRLWMLRGQLEGPAAVGLEQLITELGEPEHPDFLAWVGPMREIVHQSPVDEAAIAQMSPDELVDVLIQWKASSDTPFPDDEYRPLVGTVARVLVGDLDAYRAQIFRVAPLNAHLAGALFGHLENKNHVRQVPWNLCLELIELLLADETIRTGMDRAYPGWSDVRRNMMQLLERGLNEQDSPFPEELFDRVEALLLLLADDPDPAPLALEDADSVSSTHPENLLPLTIGLSNVRPKAISALIGLLLLRQHALATTEPENSNPLARQLPASLREVLERRLDPIQESSLGVWAIFGMRLANLHWLDAEWVTRHLDQIFPDQEDETSVQRCLAAWEGFLVGWQYAPSAELRPKLQEKYSRAVDYLLQGKLDRGYPSPQVGLIRHLVWDYLKASYALDSEEGRKSLLLYLLDHADSDVCAEVARCARDLGSTDPARFWPRLYALWEKRLSVAQAAETVDTPRAEMQHYVALPWLMREQITLDSLRGTLVATLPYVAQTGRYSLGWEQLEKYLAYRIDFEPDPVIVICALLYQQMDEPRWFRDSEERRKIFSSGAANPATRTATLNIIDDLAKRGIGTFSDIYMQYSTR
jgi:hypothetical protein